MKRIRLVSTLTVISLAAATAAVAAAPAASAAAAASYEVSAATPSTPVTAKGETFFTSDFYLVTSGTGDITLSGSSDGSSSFTIDDEATITITHADGSVSTPYTADDSGQCAGLVPSSPVSLTSYFQPGVNEVHVTFNDTCGGYVANTDVWLTGDLAVTQSAPAPTLGVSLADNSGGTARNGAVVSYVATPSVSTYLETQPLTLTDTFPAALVPQAAGLGGTGWSCGLSGQTVTCSYPANPPVPVGALPAVTMPVQVTVAAGSQPVSTDDVVSVGSQDATTATTDDPQTYSGPAATGLTFLGQPVDTKINANMTNPDGSLTHIKVAAQTTAGPTDPTYTGSVTLGFGANPGNAQFVVNGQPSSTIVAPAVNGVADISPIVVNAVGFGYTLTAAATGFPSVTSSPFDVAAGAALCPANQTCTATATAAPAAGESATVTGLSAGNATVVTASFGGNVAPIHPCNSAISGVLTFDGARQKVVNLTVATKLPILIFCYGQPTPFTDLTLRKTTYFNSINNEYEGVLGPCLGRLIPPPCISGLSFGRGSETVTVTGGSDDPRMSH